MNNLKKRIILIVGIVITLVIICITVVLFLDNYVYVFKSTFTDGKENGKKLSNYPAVKRMMLKVEDDLLYEGAGISGVSFDSSSLTGIIAVLNNEEVDDKIEFHIGEDGKKLSNIVIKAYESYRFGEMKRAVADVCGFSADEYNLLDNLGTENTSLVTPNWYVVYTETTEKTKLKNVDYNIDGSDMKEFSLKELSFVAEECKDETKTTLYITKHEQQRPIATGIGFEDYGLSFFLPDQMISNELNGMNYTWQYYTGEIVDQSPTGIFVTLKVSGEKEGEDFDTYVRTESKPAKSSDVTPFIIKDINGNKWYTCNNGKIYYYASEHDTNRFEIEIRDGQEIDGVTLQSVLEMFEKTLYY